MRHTRRVVGGVFILACATLAAAIAADPVLRIRRLHRGASGGRREDLLRRVRRVSRRRSRRPRAGAGTHRHVIRRGVVRQGPATTARPARVDATDRPEQSVGDGIRGSDSRSCCGMRRCRSVRLRCPPIVRNWPRITFGRSTGVAAPGAAAAAARHGSARNRAARRATIAAGRDHRRADDDTGRPTAATWRASATRPPIRLRRTTSTDCEIAWRLKTDFLGPRPDTLYSATPLLVGRVLYTTAGMRRAAIALDAATGEMLWMHAEDEGRRGQNAPRNGAGRGVAYWASADGSRSAHHLRHARLSDAGARREDRHPGSRVREERRRRSEARRRSGGRPRHRRARPQRHPSRRRRRDRGRRRAPPRRRAADDAERARHGAWLRCPHRQAALDFPHHSAARRVRLRHLAGELRRLQRQHRRLGADERGPASWDSSTCRSKCRRAITTAAIGPATRCSPTACSRSTSRPGERKWHYQTVHHDVWDWDLPCAPMLFDMPMNGRTIKALAQPTKSAFLFVLESRDRRADLAD